MDVEDSKDGHPTRFRKRGEGLGKELLFMLKGVFKAWGSGFRVLGVPFKGVL